MTWLAMLYAGLGYWHFRATLRAIEPYDTIDTVILNAGLALVVGPLLLVPALMFQAADGSVKLLTEGRYDFSLH